MRWGPTFLLVLAALLGAGCSEDLVDGESDLGALNDSGCTLTILVDGREAFNVAPGADRILDDIGTGQHLLEAVDPRGTVIVRRTVELLRGEDFYWTVEHC
jgi:hypothetical protein